jgi:hypothetical protein
VPPTRLSRVSAESHILRGRPHFSLPPLLSTRRFVLQPASSSIFRSNLQTFDQIRKTKTAAMKQEVRPNRLSPPGRTVEGTVQMFMLFGLLVYESMQAIS